MPRPEAEGSARSCSRRPAAPGVSRRLLDRYRSRWSGPGDENGFRRLLTTDRRVACVGPTTSLEYRTLQPRRVFEDTAGIREDQDLELRPDPPRQLNRVVCRPVEQLRVERSGTER